MIQKQLPFFQNVVPVVLSERIGYTKKVDLWKGLVPE